MLITVSDVTSQKFRINQFFPTKTLPMKFPNALGYRLLDRLTFRIILNRVYDLAYRLKNDLFESEASEYEQHKLNRLIEIICQQNYKNVLDVGCGIGILAEKISPCCQRIIGIDFSPKAISLARNRCGKLENVSFLERDIRTFDFQDDYDLIIFSEVLYYLEDKFIERIINRLKKNLSDSARIIIVDRAEDSYSVAKFKREFQLMNRIQETNWFRPFAITWFEVGNLTKESN